MTFKFLGARQALCAAMLALAMPLCWAWSAKPVRIVVPAPPGGLMDVFARVLAEQLAADVGQPFIVDNKPGAGGFIGIKSLLSAPADGLTVMVTASNVLTEIPLVMKFANFDSLKDIKPVVGVGLTRLVLVASPDLPAKNLSGLITYLKEHPDKLNYASYSTGTASHYGGALLARRAGLNMQHAPFAGAPPAITQVMGKQITMMFDNIPHSLPYLQAGKLHPYAVASKVRSPLLPNVPTFQELGLPEIDFTNWVGVVVDPRVTPEMTERIRAAVLKAAATPKMRDRIISMGYEPVPPQSQAELVEATRAEHQRNAALVKAFDIRGE